MSRLTFRAGGAAVWASFIVVGLAWLLASSHRSAHGADVSAGLRVEIGITGIARPIQLALDTPRRLVVLSHGWPGDAAAASYRVRPGCPPALQASRAHR